LVDDLDAPALREAATERAIAVAGQPEDPRNIAIRSILLDPAIRDHYRDARLEFRSWNEEKRYMKDLRGGEARQLKGKILQENVLVSIERGDVVVFRRTYRGNRPRKGEAFDAGYPMQGGYLIRMNPAVVDLVGICEALLQPLEKSQVELARSSKNKYISTAAVALLDSWARLGVAATPSQDDEEDDD
jgi:hypothetical protein